jgi:hypothetical protein
MPQYGKYQSIYRRPSLLQGKRVKENFIYYDSPMEVELPDGVFIREPSAKFYKLGFAHEIPDTIAYNQMFKPYNA